jgi:hypothetical protein
MRNMAKSIRHLFMIQLKQMKGRRCKTMSMITPGRSQERLDILQHIRRLVWKTLFVHQLRTLWKVKQIQSNHDLTEAGLGEELDPWFTYLRILGGERLTTGSRHRVTRDTPLTALTAGSTTMRNAAKGLIVLVEDWKTKILASVLV